MKRDPLAIIEAACVCLLVAFLAVGLWGVWS